MRDTWTDSIRCYVNELKRTWDDREIETPVWSESREPSFKRSAWTLSWSASRSECASRSDPLTLNTGQLHFAHRASNSAKFRSESYWVWFAIQGLRYSRLPIAVIMADLKTDHWPSTFCL
jgi:hypothetical protein